MIKFTSIQYDAIMTAINNAKHDIHEDAFIDPYDNHNGYTNEGLLKALDEVETMFMNVEITDLKK